MFYSKSTKGFYTTEIHGNKMPSDVVGITEEYHQELMDGQSQGKEISHDANGYPILVDRQPLPYDLQRQYAYPSIGDQLDALYHAGVFPADMAAKIKAVKDMYPK
jgi:hypothetical protein